MNLLMSQIHKIEKTIKYNFVAPSKEHWFHEKKKVQNKQDWKKK